MATREDAKKTIDELLTQYQLHPELQDIFVEGAWDRSVVQWVLRHAGINNPVIYDIEAVEIPFELAKKHYPFDGKKGRVIALANELDGKLAHSSQVTCVADADFDNLLGIHCKSALLFQTDYCCQEMYFFSPVVIDKFLSLAFRSYPYSAQHLIAAIGPPLRELHLLRAANQKLMFGLHRIKLKNCCSLKGDTFVVDIDGYKIRYLGSKGRIKDLEMFNATIESLRQELKGDVRYHISKTDFFELLAEYLPYYSKESIWNSPKVIEASLLPAVDAGDIMKEHMYANLIERLRRS